MTGGTPPAAQDAQRGGILLVEPSSLTGGIIVATARQLALPAVRQVTSVRTAQQQLASRGFSGLIVSLEETQDALALMEQVRAAQYAVRPGVPMAVTTARVDISTAAVMKVLQVRRVLLTPFKVRDVITTIEMLQAAA